MTVASELPTADFFTKSAAGKYLDRGTRVFNCFVHCTKAFDSVGM